MPTSQTHKGPTPNGGVSSTIYYKDDNGNPADKSVATAAEVVEYDAKGKPLWRTCASLTPPNSHPDKTA